MQLKAFLACKQRMLIIFLINRFLGFRHKLLHVMFTVWITFQSAGHVIRILYFDNIVVVKVEYKLDLRTTRRKNFVEALSGIERKIAKSIKLLRMKKFV